MSGTSHATPYMSGGLALLLQLENEREESLQGPFRYVIHEALYHCLI
jgi:subtilisin family serine protease